MAHGLSPDVRKQERHLCPPASPHDRCDLQIRLVHGPSHPLGDDTGCCLFRPHRREGKTVEADETFLTKSPKTRKPEGHVKCSHTAPMVFSLVERGGNIRSMYLDHKNVRKAVRQHLDQDSRLVTDGAQHFKFIMPTKDQHESVDHSKFEFVRGDVHTNTLEGFFSIFKRGLVGTYQHIDNKHLDRYLAEFDFRQNTRAKLGIDDTTRTAMAVKGSSGKRLTYRRIDNGANV